MRICRQVLWYQRLRGNGRKGHGTECGGGGCSKPHIGRIGTREMEPEGYRLLWATAVDTLNPVLGNESLSGPPQVRTGPGHGFSMRRWAGPARKQFREFPGERPAHEPPPGDSGAEPFRNGPWIVKPLLIPTGTFVLFLSSPTGALQLDVPTTHLTVCTVCIVSQL